MDQSPSLKELLIIKLLQIRQEFHAIGFDEAFWITHQTIIAKETTDKPEFMTVCKCCASGDNINRVKRQSTKWEKIFVNHLFYRY